ncbi:hypothetical protein D3C81_1408680 [compost metagenome]
MRDQHNIPGFFRVDRGQLFAHTFGERRVAANENRDIGTQRKAQFSQLIFAAIKLPQMVQAEQGGGRIRAATTDSAAHGQDFGQPDVGAQGAAGQLLQLACSLDDQVAVVGHVFNVAVQADLAIVADGELQFVSMVEELEQGLQLVIPVRAATEDVQHQVELGWSGQGQAGHFNVPAGVAASPLPPPSRRYSGRAT